MLVGEGELAGFVGFVEPISSSDRLDYLVANDLWYFLGLLLARDLGERW